jgi:DNA polymerase sigma
LKHWISARAINDASQNGGTLNSYTHVLLMLSYLQLMRVIPPLQRICCGRYPSTAVHRSCVDYYNASPARICVVCGNSLPSYPAETYETYFYTGNVEKSPNEMSIGELAIGFFRYYAFEFDYANDCVSVRMGGVISRAAKGWEDQKGSRMRGMDGQPAALCVEDPFILERNCAVSAIRRSIAGIRWEYERALRALLSYRSLDQLCSKWVDWPTSYYKQLQVYQSHIQL